MMKLCDTKLDEKSARELIINEEDEFKKVMNAFISSSSSNNNS